MSNYKVNLPKRMEDFMYKINDYVVYKKDVCKIINIKSKDKGDYYNLVPVSDDSLKIDVPTDNEQGFIRDLVSKKEIDRIISKMPEIDVLTSTNNMLENNYKELLRDGSFESLIKIIKTAYLRNKEREDNNKKKSDRDTYYLNLAEKYLYTEFAVVLGLSVDETRDYIINEILKGNNL